MEKEEIFIKLIKIYGKNQLFKLIEEMSELTKEIIKYSISNDKKKKKEIRGNVMEEIADVELMLEQTKMYFFISQENIDAMKNYKLQRTAKRLLEEEK